MLSFKIFPFKYDDGIFSTLYNEQNKICRLRTISVSIWHSEDEIVNLESAVLAEDGDTMTDYTIFVI